MSFDRAAQLFEELLSLGASERAARLGEFADESGEVLGLVREMLAGEEEREPGLDRTLHAAPVSSIRLEPGSRIGPFEVLELLGEGGMGVVYKALQDMPRRTVALKLLRPGYVHPEVLQRFRHEAEVLAWLDHPGIARVYDAGTAPTATGEQPYLAMELVEGEHIDRWVERNKPSIDARLELLARLAEAVHHAHQKGVVHRDLKPANILVTPDGQLKVLDFGIARITDSDLSATTLQTRTGVLLGTLPFMSPEQVAGDPSQVDVRTDVYALGVLSYELLAGVRPLDVTDLSVVEAARVIADVEPALLGTRDPRLRGDVEIVVQKALAKDKERRFASAGELARDLRRTLANEPILARPPSGIYRLAKFSRRNRGLVAGLVATVVLLAAGTTTATAQYLEKARLLAVESDEALATNEAIGFLESILEQADPYTEEELSVREVSRIAAARIATEFTDRPGMRGRLLQMLGRTHSDLGMHPEARALLQEALELRIARFGGSSAEVAETLVSLGVVERTLEGAEVAEANLRRGVELTREHRGEGAELVEALSSLGNALIDLRRFDEAAELQAEALAIAERELAPTHPQRLSIRHNIASRLLVSDHIREAEEAFTDLLASVPRDATLRFTILAMLAHANYLQDRSARAEALQRQVIALATAKYGATASYTRRQQQQLANILSATGKIEEAVRVMRGVRDAVLERGGAGTRDAVRATHDLAFAVHELADNAEAEGLYLEALDGFRELWNEDWPDVFQTQHNLAMLYYSQNRIAEAEPLERAALAGRRRTLPEGHTDTLSSLRGMGDILMRQRRWDEAVAIRSETLPHAIAAFGAVGPYTFDVRFKLLDALLAAHAFEEAERVLEDAAQAAEEAPEETGVLQRIERGFNQLYDLVDREGDRAAEAGG